MAVHLFPLLSIIFRAGGEVEIFQIDLKIDFYGLKFCTKHFYKLNMLKTKGRYFCTFSAAIQFLSFLHTFHLLEISYFGHKLNLLISSTYWYYSKSEIIRNFRFRTQKPTFSYFFQKTLHLTSPMLYIL